MAASDSGHPDIPDSNLDNPFRKDTFLHQKFEKIYKQDRDIVFIISDMEGRRGTGKTVGSLQLGNMLDQTDEGLTWDKCTLSGEEFINAYSENPQKSALVLDEAEISASNRDAMTNLNKALRKMMSIGRVEQKYVVVNVPLKHFIDTDIRKLADIWIGMQRRGRGLVHHLKWEAYSETLQTPKKQTIEFDDIDTGTRLRDVYNKLTREKRKHIRGEDGDSYVPKGEHEDAVAKAREQARKEVRNEFITSVYERLSGLDEDDLQRISRANGVSQAMIGDAVGLTQQQIGNIVRADD